MTTPTTASPLHERYGGDVPEAAPANDVLDLLYRHRSVRGFTAEPVDEATVSAVVAAAQSAATSSNLQTWSVVELRDPERKAQAAALSGGQDFIRDAPVFLVFIADWARNRLLAERRGAPSEGVDFLDSTLVAFVDAALAAQNAVIAAESLGLGTVYIGGVRNAPEQLSELLGLPDGAFPVVGLVLGHPDDSAGVKPRLPQRIVRHRERYAVASDDELVDYDRRIGDYYRSQGLDRGWLESVLGRVRDAASLHGRHALRAAAERRGLPSR